MSSKVQIKANTTEQSRVFGNEESKVPKINI